MLGLDPISRNPIAALSSDAEQISITILCTSVVSATITNPIAQLFQSPFGFIIAAEIDRITLFSSSRFYVSTYPFISRNIDTPANQPFDSLLAGTIRIDQSIEGGNGFSGFNEQLSEIVLINAESDYDQFTTTFSINGQRIRLALGGFVSPNLVDTYNSFEPFAIITGERAWANRKNLTIEARDQATILVNKTVQQNLYGGTGSFDGDVDIAGKRRPKGFGIVFNATPTLVIGNLLIWQFNDGAAVSVEAVKDGGVALTPWLDFPTKEALLPLTPPAGSYATCLAEGYIMLGSSSFKQITVDFTIAAQTTADIIHSIAVNSAGLTGVGPTPTIDEQSFVQLNATQPALIGYYLDEASSETCSETFTKLMTGIGGWWGMTPLGLLHVEIFSAPTTISSGSYDTHGGNITELDEIQLPTDIDPPPKRRRMIYSRNWTVMTDLFAAVSDADPDLADRLKKPNLLAISNLPVTVMVLYPGAPDPDPTESYFANLTDAQNEANRLFTLYTSNYRLYQFTLKQAMFVHTVGQIVKVTDSRFGLIVGRYLRIVAISEDLNNMTTQISAFG